VWLNPPGTGHHVARVTVDGPEGDGEPRSRPFQPTHEAGPNGRPERPVTDLSAQARVFPGCAMQVSVARRFVASLLDGSPWRDDAVVVVSELFTNALRHTESGRPGGLVVVSVGQWPGGVRIAVTDQGSADRPVIRNPGPDRQPADSGNGLYLVARLSGRLEWHDDDWGRTICAVLGRPAAGQHLCPQDASGSSGLPLQLPQSASQPV
jgi:serine/threonine-protein kinase RsbW